jgi:hypothetical protein
VSCRLNALNELWIAQEIADGAFNMIIVQPEQLSRLKGHLTHFGRLLRRPQFARIVSRVHADESHLIYHMGMPLYGRLPFRPSYGQLNQLRVRLSRRVPVQAVSGTLPPHIKNCIASHLQIDLDSALSIKMSANRPNIVYALHQIVGKITDYRNLAFLIPPSVQSIQQIPRCMVFVDDKKHSRGAINFLKSLLPPELLTGDSPFRHYDSLMSERYLERTFKDFQDVNGTCRVFFGTEAASTVSISALCILLTVARDCISKILTFAFSTALPMIYLLLFSAVDDLGVVLNVQRSF